MGYDLIVVLLAFGFGFSLSPMVLKPIYLFLDDHGIICDGECIYCGGSIRLFPVRARISDPANPAYVSFSEYHRRCFKKARPMEQVIPRAE